MHVLLNVFSCRLYCGSTPADCTLCCYSFFGVYVKKAADSYECCIGAWGYV
jgi:hypothetical protein